MSSQATQSWLLAACCDSLSGIRPGNLQRRAFTPHAPVPVNRIPAVQAHKSRCRRATRVHTHALAIPPGCISGMNDLNQRMVQLPAWSAYGTIERVRYPADRVDARMPTTYTVPV